MWMQDDCKYECECFGGGQYECLPNRCHRYATCGLDNGVRDCYCNDGFEGNGLICVPGKNSYFLTTNRS